jgi:hypothetical protein
MLLPEDRVRSLAAAAFDSRPGAVVYADRSARAPGEVQLAGQRIVTRHPSLLLFRDEMPGANWMHACTYALVDLVTSEVLARVASDRPPVFGLLPESWAVASDPGGHADLVRTALDDSRHPPTSPGRDP